MLPNGCGLTACVAVLKLKLIRIKIEINFR